MTHGVSGWRCGVVHFCHGAKVQVNGTQINADAGGREIVNAKFPASWVSQHSAPHCVKLEREEKVGGWCPAWGRQTELVVGDIWTLTESSSSSPK